MTPITTFERLSHEWVMHLFGLRDQLNLPSETYQVISDYITLLDDYERHLLQQYSGTEDYYNEMYNM